MAVVEHELFDTAIKLIEKCVAKDVVTPSVDEYASTLVNAIVHLGMQLTSEKLHV